jgi:uncharacterized membrane protein
LAGSCKGGVDTVLAFTCVSHLAFEREEFQAQVPPWMPQDPDLVLASGVVEIALGARG